MNVRFVHPIEFSGNLLVVEHHLMSALIDNQARGRVMQLIHNLFELREIEFMLAVKEIGADWVRFPINADM